MTKDKRRATLHPDCVMWVLTVDGEYYSVMGKERLTEAEVVRWLHGLHEVPRLTEPFSPERLAKWKQKRGIK